MSQDLSIDVVVAEHNLTVLICGDLDLRTVGQLRTAVAPCLDDHAVRAVIVDLDAVSFLDAGGLAGLETIRGAAAAAGKHFALGNVPRPVMRLLTITGFGTR